MEKKNKKDKPSIGVVVIVLVLLIYIVSLIGVSLTEEETDNKFNVGDTWVYYTSDNPFHPDGPKYRKIIKIDRNYIQFIENEKDTLVLTSHNFLLWCEKVE